jgi:hypothetical protein
MIVGTEFEYYLSGIRSEFEYYINRIGGYKTDDTAFGIEFSINGIKGKIEKLKHGYYINFNGVADYGTKRTVLNVLESYWDSISL